MQENDLEQAANHPPALPLVVVIEPREEKAFATRLAGQTEDLWTTEVVTTVAQLQSLKDQGLEPVCIGFHASQANLPNGRPWNPDPFHQALKTLGWAGITVLVSAGQEGLLEKFTNLATTKGYEGAVARDSWMAYLRERVGYALAKRGVDRDETLVVPPKDAALDWGALAQKLGPAVVVLREPKPGQAPQKVAENPAAQEIGWERSDLRRWSWLRAQLDVFRREHPQAQAQARAHLLDWDGDKQLPVECRLYELGKGLFWYMRDWRWDREQAIDEVFARIERERSLAGRFDGLADYLAHRWSISRLRLFEVAALPDGRGTLHEAGHWVPEHSSSAVSFLVLPRLQSGLGWSPVPGHGSDSADERQPAGWWRKRFTWATFTAGQQDRPEDIQTKENWIARAAVDPAALKVREQHYLYESMDQPCEASLAVDWGTCKRRLLVLVPQPPQASPSQTLAEAESVSPLVAMLDMDRRSDHLIGANAKQFSDRENQRIDILSDGVIGEELDAEVVKSMNHGALSAVRDRLGQWLADAQQARARAWEVSIGQAIAQTVGQGQGMAALSKLCDALLAAWPKLWQEERARLSRSGQLQADTPPGPNLAQLFFVTPVGERLVAMPAGSGAAWAHYNTQPSWPMVTPFADLLRSDAKLDQGRCWVMQDFQTWWKKQDRKNLAFQQAAPHCFDQTGSWVALRLPDAPGVAPVLMVAHFDGEPNQVWQEVLQLLHRAAHHVRAPFLLAWSEQQERSVWAASVAHEMKNMALLALHDARQHANTSPLLLERLQQQLNLAEDFLFNLRPDLSPNSGPSTQVQVVDVQGLLQDSLSWWQAEQAHTEQPDVQWAAGVDFSQVPLVGAQAWQRVLRVLLHNAFEHGSGGVRLTVSLQHGADGTTPPGLQLLLENRASDTAVQLLNATANPSLVAVPSAYVRRHIGLKTARALCQQAGAVLNIEAHNGQVTAKLIWPMASLSGATAHPATPAPATHQATTHPSESTP